MNGGIRSLGSSTVIVSTLLKLHPLVGRQVVVSITNRVTKEQTWYNRWVWMSEDYEVWMSEEYEAGTLPETSRCLFAVTDV